MIINFKNSYLFIHIPKCAGESITELLTSDLNRGVKFLGKHDYLQKALHVMEEKINSFTTFSVVRNPFHQVVSYYEHLRKPLYISPVKLKTQYPGYKGWLEPKISCKLAMELDFKDWVKKVYLKKKGCHPWHGDYLKWLVDDNNILRVDKILKFEELKNDFPKLQSELGIQGKLPHKNKSIDVNYQDYYDAETKDIIYQEFKASLDLFNYEFESQNLNCNYEVNPKLITIEDYRSSAKQHKKNGNFSEAIEAYQKVTELQPQSLDYYELGMLWLEKQDWEAALFCYEKLLFLEKKSSKETQNSQYFLLGVSLVKNGKIKQVIDCYHRVFQKDLQNLSWYYWLSISLSEAGLIPEAVSLFTEWPKPNYLLPEAKINNDASDSIYARIWRWSWFNQTNTEEFNFDIEEINSDNFEPEANEIQEYFAQDKIIKFNIKKLKESDKEHLKTLGISLEYLQIIALENNDLENIYINYFNEELQTNPLARAQYYPHKRLSTPDRRFQTGVEYSQTIAESGYICAIDPLTGNLVRSNESFYIRDLKIIYRFVGAEVFYILTSDFGNWRISLYIPRFEIILILSDKSHLAIKSSQKDYNTLKSYFVTYFREVKQYIHSQQPRLLTSIVGFRKNLGHFFWQELNGIFYLYKNNLLDKIDCLAVGNYQHLEVAEVFPELKNKKQLILEDLSELKKFQLLLKSNCLCFRVVEHFITQEYVSRIYDVAWHKCSDNFREVLPNRENNQQCFPLLWVNLRTHNKSWKSQERGYANIINKLSEDFPNIGIVFDGWIDCNEIVESIVKQLKQDIKIYNTLGCPLHESIVWAHQIDTYICVVGSGLVITSWLSDRPGVAHANQLHLGQKNFWSLVKENAVTPSFLRPKEIKQRQKTPYGNYQVNWRIIYKTIFNILKKIEK